MMVYMHERKRQRGRKVKEQCWKATHAKKQKEANGRRQLTVSPLPCNFVSTVATGTRRYSRKIFPKNASPSKTGVCSTKKVVNAWYTFIYTIFTLRHYSDLGQRASW
jgi:hypothetical protein